ncbi:MAG: hypothetical protein WD995_08460 [Gemmatimonadota bacterium]
MRRTLKTVGIAALAAAAAGVLTAFVVRDQMTRHQRNLFSPRTRKRLAALGHMGREPASVAYIRLLRDFIAWEPRKLLRDRARSIVVRMEDEVGERDLRLEAPGA